MTRSRSPGRRGGFDGPGQFEDPAPGAPTLEGRRADVAVVGAGLSGLVLTRELRERGVDAVAVEAATVPGGVVRTRRVDGRVLDVGPQRTRLTPAVRGLLCDLGIDDEVVTAAALPLYVHWDGRLRRAPLSPRAAVTTDLLSLRGKLRVLAEPLTGPPREGESVAAFCERTLGREAARRAVCPVYAGLYGSDPDEMPVEHSLGRALARAGIEDGLLVGAARKLLRRRIRGDERPPAATFEGGMARLPAALYRSVADRVRLDAPARRLHRADGADGRYRLVTDAGALTADAVALTVPAPVAGRLLADVAPDSAARLSGLSYNPLAVVHLRADLDREAMGCLVPGEEYALLGSTWNDPAFGRDGVYTAYLGGARDPEVVEYGDHRLGALAAREFAAVTGARDPAVLSVERIRPGMPAYDRSWDALAECSLPPGVAVCANYAARAGIPGRIRDATHVARRLADRAGERSTPSPTGGDGDGTGIATPHTDGDDR